MQKWYDFKTGIKARNWIARSQLLQSIANDKRSGADRIEGIHIKFLRHENNQCQPKKGGIYHFRKFTGRNFRTVCY